jgi:hypothetical protein
LTTSAGSQRRRVTAVGHPTIPAGPVTRIGADLTDYGQTIEALQGADAVVHLANIPAPSLFTPSHTFTANTAMNSGTLPAPSEGDLRSAVASGLATALLTCAENPAPT